LLWIFSWKINFLRAFLHFLAGHKCEKAAWNLVGNLLPVKDSLPGG